MAKATLKATVISIPPLKTQELVLTIVGDSPLICHQWSDKAKKQMLDKQMKKGSTGKKAKSPEQDYADSLYSHPDGGYGFPAVAFKSCAVAACRSIDDLPMTKARAAFHVLGEMVKIEGEPRPREDMVRIGQGTADIRYRAEFPEWRCQLLIRFNTAVLSAEQIATLFNVGGFSCGVGEWRPEKNGSHGMFHIE